MQDLTSSSLRRSQPAAVCCTHGVNVQTACASTYLVTVRSDVTVLRATHTRKAYVQAAHLVLINCRVHDLLGAHAALGTVRSVSTVSGPADTHHLTHSNCTRLLHLSVMPELVLAWFLFAHVCEAASAMPLSAAATSSVATILFACFCMMCKRCTRSLRKIVMHDQRGQEVVSFEGCRQLPSLLVASLQGKSWSNLFKPMIHRLFTT